MKGTLVLLLGMIGSLVAASDLPRLRVEGDPILAGEKKIRLRGINRGWWNSRGTRYTEENMKQLSERDANVLRLRDNPSGDNGSSGSEKRRQLLSGQSASAERPEKSLGKESRMTVLPAIGSDMLLFPPGRRSAVLPLAGAPVRKRSQTGLLLEIPGEIVRIRIPALIGDHFDLRVVIPQQQFGIFDPPLRNILKRRGVQIPGKQVEQGSLADPRLLCQIPHAERMEKMFFHAVQKIGELLRHLPAETGLLKFQKNLVDRGKDAVVERGILFRAEFAGLPEEGIDAVGPVQMNHAGPLIESESG